MCTTCHLPPVDEAATDAFADRLLDILNHGGLGIMISIGHRSGLFDAMQGQPPLPSEQIAKAAGLHERYVREWLGAMVTGRIVEYDAGRKTYQLPYAHAACLTRRAAPNNLAAFTQYIPLLGSMEERVLECFENGGGVPYEEFDRFQSVMAEDSGQTVLPVLIDEILPLVPGLVERLEAGIDVLDVGFGMGKALNLMARHFPKSRFTGYEISDEGILGARSEAGALGLSNVRFVQQDAASFGDREAFDLICTFDAVHDQADPAALLRNIHRALRPAGVYLMQDIDTHTDVGENLDHPMGPMIYTISCLHCMTVSLAAGGAGLGAAWGVELATEMLEDASFGSVTIERLPHDVQNAYFIVRK